MKSASQNDHIQETADQILSAKRLIIRKDYKAAYDILKEIPKLKQKRRTDAQVLEACHLILNKIARHFAIEENAKTRFAQEIERLQPKTQASEEKSDALTSEAQNFADKVKHLKEKGARWARDKNFQQAIPFYEKALRILQDPKHKALRESSAITGAQIHLMEGEVLKYLANCHYQSGALQLAETYFRQSIAQYDAAQEHLPPSSQDEGRHAPYGYLMQIFEKQKRTQELTQYAQKALLSRFVHSKDKQVAHYVLAHHGVLKTIILPHSEICQHFEQALLLKKEVQEEYWLYQANMFKKHKEWDQGLKCCLSVKDSSDLDRKIAALGGIVGFYISLGNLLLARQFAEDVIALFQAHPRTSFTDSRLENIGKCAGHAAHYFDHHPDPQLAPDPIRAVAYYQIAVTLTQNYEVHHNWAYKCEQGEDLPQPNIPDAIQHYLIAAKQGYVYSQSNLAIILLTDPVHKNVKQGMKWLSAAGDQNYPSALNSLGEIHLIGKMPKGWTYEPTRPEIKMDTENESGFPAINHETARSYFQRAADLNYVQSQVNLVIIRIFELRPEKDKKTNKGRTR